jgi:peptide deformylase
MATLDIKKYPESILRKKCQEIKEITPEIKELILNMAETMLKNQGIGLAAPQVGVLKKLIVVGTEKGPLAFINPKVIKKSKETEIGEEGCLSFPGIWLKIKRAKGVEIESLNEMGEKICFKTEGLPARIFQHEIDHLDGILFIDRLNLWQNLKFKLKL